MVLIIGGAYQGKLDFAKSTFDLSESDVFTCTGGEIDFSKRCIDHIEEFTLGARSRGWTLWNSSGLAGSGGRTAFSFVRTSLRG